MLGVFIFYIMTEVKFELLLYFDGDVNSDEEIEEIGRNILNGLVHQANHHLAPEDSDVVTTKIEIGLPWNLGYIEKCL
jgi:hypothetical protein